MGKGDREREKEMREILKAIGRLGLRGRTMKIEKFGKLESVSIHNHTHIPLSPMNPPIPYGVQQTRSWR